MKKSVIILLFLFLYSSCNTIPTKDEIAALTPIIEMEKGPCYNQCQIFKLSIFDNGLIQYYGEDNTKKKGTFIKRMAQNDLRKLLKSFRDANFFGFSDAYRSNIPDNQTVTITFNDGGRTKTVAGKDNRPEDLMELQSLLDKIANSEGWQKKEGADEQQEQFGNEIIVNLVRGVSTEDWLDKYKTQNVQLKDALSPTGNYLLISFNAELISPEDMLEMIRRDQQVLGAEFNQEVFNR